MKYLSLIQLSFYLILIFQSLHLRLNEIIFYFLFLGYQLYLILKFDFHVFHPDLKRLLLYYLYLHNFELFLQLFGVFLCFLPVCLLEILFYSSIFPLILSLLFYFINYNFNCDNIYGSITFFLWLYFVLELCIFHFFFQYFIFEHDYKMLSFFNLCLFFFY